LKVLFYMGERSFPARHFEGLLTALLDRGDAVHIVFSDRKGAPAEGSLVHELSRRFAGLTYGAAPQTDAAWRWDRQARRLRLTIDYAFFLHPDLRRSEALRARLRGRVGRRTAGALDGLARLPDPLSVPALGLVSGVLRALERVIPPRPEVVRLIESERPELVLTSPLVVGETPEPDYLRAAKRVGIATGICVASWDNLTTKGRIHETPDFITVWNEAMKAEAVHLHGVPPERVVVTGAQSFDHWFDWQPSTTREEFCERVGLDPQRPFVLWLCSSEFVVGDREPAFIESWLGGIRGRDEPALAGVQLLVRPHPSVAARQWRRRDSSALGPGATVWPLEGFKRSNPRSRHDFFDSIYHSATVVGVNTSALIEAAIVGRSVHTWRAPELRGAQAEMPHFRLISDFEGGLLEEAEDFETHARQLAAALDSNGTGEERRRRFLEAFVRPHGLAQPVGPRLLAAIDERAGARHDVRS
jgi:hypothetical protein